MQEADARLSEALEDLQGYLADTLAPLLVADAVETLLDYPPAMTAEQLRLWAFFQFEGRHGATPLSDLLYHAIKKVQQLEVHQLVPAERFTPFLATLAGELLVACPPEERERLGGLLRHLRESVGSATARVEHLLRPAAGGGPQPVASPPAPPPGPAETRDLRRFSLALERALAGLAAGGAAPAGTAQQLAVLAAAGAQSTADFEARLARLHEAGLAPAGSADLFRTLVGAVPDWAVALPRAERPPAGSLEAVHRAVRLAGSRENAGERWKELLAAAAEQFNARAFGRATALLDLAERMVRDAEVDPRLADIALGNAHEAYEISALLEAAAERRHRPVLRRLLELFPAWSVRELLEALVFQPDAKKRRLLIALLEVWGAEARRAVVDRLEISVAEASRDPNVWWYQRNLVFLMHRLPREEGADAARELSLVAPFSSLSFHPSFQREAITLLGQLPGHLGVATLVQRLAEAERSLEGPQPATQQSEETWKVMNALAAALVRSGTPAARRALLDHALARRPRDGDSLARLRELARVDLASDRETVSRLLGALRDLAPRKLLGFVVGRHTEEMAHVAWALSGTSAPEVRNALAELTARFPELELARAEPTPAGGPAEAPGGGEPAAGGESEPVGLSEEPAVPHASMSGDLEVFGLAGLLQSFQQSEVSGRLVLRDGRGQPFAELSLHAGRLAACHAGRLESAAAFYQLFETPSRGTFEFQRSESTAAAPPGLRDLVGLLLEAMRRYDELQRLRAVVPDALRLQPTGSRPTAPEEERDGDLVRRLWERARGGATAADCETAVAVDSYRVRSLLAHWLDEGALAPAS